MTASPIHPLRIVHASAYFAPAYAFGGPPRSLLALCQAQAGAGLDLEVFTTTANPGAPLPADPDGRDVHGVRVRYFPLSPPASLLGAQSMRRPLAAALGGADLVHLHGLFNRTVWTAARAARAARVPVVVSPRGMLEPAARAHHGWRKRAAWALCDRRVMESATCWHATSGAEAATLAAIDPLRRIVEIPNCVPPVVAGEPAIAEARRFAGVPGDRTPYVLFLGRVHPLKRLDLLADAFGRAAAVVPEAHLVVAGPDENGHRAEVGPRFDGLGARVHWCGPVDGPLKDGLIAGAAALVLCSDSESFGMSVAEALSAGVPVVVTRTCPWPAIETARCGHWVDQTPAAVAAGLLDLLTHPDDARAKGERGRALAARTFAAAEVGERWRGIYGEIVAAHRSRHGRAA